MPAKRFDSAELAALEPALQPGHGRRLPLRVRRSPAARPANERTAPRARRKQESRFDENCEVTGIVCETGKAKALRTTIGDIDADHFVLATGAWTPLLNRGTRLSHPHPTRQGLFHHHAAAGPLSDAPVDLRGTPRRGHAVRLGLSARFDDGIRGLRRPLNRSRLTILTEAAKLYLKEPLAEPVQEEWWGWRPMTFDGAADHRLAARPRRMS